MLKVTQKRKKVQIQIVKIFLLFFIQLVHLGLYGQVKIEGEFTRISPLLSINGSSKITFMKDSIFKSTDYQSSDRIIISHGKYQATQDTLFLYYKKTLQQDSSYYIVRNQAHISVTKEDNTNYSQGLDSLFINMTVYDSESKPINKANVVTVTKKRTDLVKGSDKNGRVNLSLTDKEIKKIQIWELGLKSLFIDTDKFWGKATELDVFLNASPYYYNQEERTIKFIVDEVSDGSIISFGGKVKVRYSKKHKR